MGKLINIDNGGTLTDVIVIDGGIVHCVKTMTTPEDLSQCFFEGLRAASQLVYGEENLAELLHTTDFIRYSTTQGTNALVQRRGPRLGLVIDDAALAGALGDDSAPAALVATLLGARIAVLGEDPGGADGAVVAAVNTLTGAGANRIVVSLSGAGYAEAEQRFKRVALRRFPPHMLGTVPMLYSHEVVDEPQPVMRTWTALFNAFLHAPMETFLYQAEQRLREYHLKSPLLIFRNDGGAARVAKTKAIKSYSSGPRGGLEGVRALARHYALDDVVSVDIGGTTTDIGQVRGGRIPACTPGRIEGIPIAFPLAAITSRGIGGGSVIRARGRAIDIGPESMGAVPGPACFARGGTSATITDVMLAAGVLDAAAFFGGRLRLDAARALAAARTAVAVPLGIDDDAALVAMMRAWIGAAAHAIAGTADVGAGGVIAAFGGAGPLLMCAIAAELGVTRVLIPGTAAVFSAVGIGFSDLTQEYRAARALAGAGELGTTLAELEQRAARDMFAEGIALAECAIEARLYWHADGVTHEQALDLRAPVLPGACAGGRAATIVLSAAKPLAHTPLRDPGPARTHVATAATERRILGDDGARAVLPVYCVADLRPGAWAAGPAILEDAYFTALVPAGWVMDLNANHDIWLSRDASRGTP